ncbi:unnamed protein product [Moneuplotes crassus]|uniref:Uncharacterized protein n=1 Tax=Euplotes crassus TaxID=5936 RepID=A0AAD2D6A8_EUPCR|nr:unnamed protein product [Moneuplotes crassus]
MNQNEHGKVEEEKTYICEVCKGKIPMSKKFMHDLTCEKNTYYCTKCKERLPKSLKAEHEGKMHFLKKCKLCPYKVLAYQYGDHDEICPNRLIKCPYCDVIFKVCEFTIHADYCGSKTYKCEKCLLTLTKREKEFHDSHICSTTQAYLNEYPEIGKYQE